MHLDPRYPIGILLATCGAILGLQGAVAREAVLGLNVDVIWGAVMFVCGLVALHLARRPS